MKNIWKFLMVAMMAIAMVGCPQPEPDPAPAAKGNKATGNGSVYTATITADMMAEPGYWGSTKSDTDPTQTVKFILVPCDVTFKGEASFTNANKIYVYSHNDIDNGHIYINQIPEGGYLQVVSRLNLKPNAYKGTAVKKNTDGSYTIMIDLAKITKEQLCAKGKAEAAMGTDSWKNFSKIATNYVPYLIGSVTGNVYDAEKEVGYEDFDITMWNAGVIKMEPAEAFPTNVTEPVVNVPVIDWAEVTTLSGVMNGWGSIDIVKGVATFTYDATSDIDVAFGLHNADWSYKLVGFEIKALDTFVNVLSADSVGAGSDAKIAASVGLKKGEKYSLVLEKLAGDKEFKIKLVKGEGKSDSNWTVTPAGDESSVVEPESSIVEPESSVVEPESSIVEPESSIVEPESSIVEPESSVVEPESSVVEPESSVVEPESSVVEPESSEPDPSSNDSSDSSN